MRNKNMLFSELGGFVIYDRLVLNKYLEKNELFDTDILSYFTGTNHGDTVIQKGVVVPILNIPPDYYSIKMVNNSFFSKYLFNTSLSKMTKPPNSEKSIFLLRIVYFYLMYTSHFSFVPFF